MSVAAYMADDFEQSSRVPVAEVCMLTLLLWCICMCCRLSNWKGAIRILRSK